MKLPPALEAVLFDMDGVLLLSTEAHARAYTQVLAERGIADFEYRRYAGLRTAEAMAAILAERGLSPSGDELAGLVAASRRWRAKPGTADTHPVRLPRTPHAARPELQAGAGQLRLGPPGRALPGRSGCRDLFDCVIDGSRVRAAKPDPECYRLAQHELGVTAERCLVVEDAASGIAAARQLGMKVVALVGTLPAAELLAAGADWVVEDLFDLVGGAGVDA